MLRAIDARTLWEVASLWAQVLDAWSGIPQAHKVTMPTPVELGLF